MVKIKHSKPTIVGTETTLLQEVFKTEYVGCGDYVKRFEEMVLNYLNVKYAVATNSGTSALHLALLALDIKPGDKVVIPTYVCPAVLHAVCYVNAEPILVDIDKVDFNISIDACLEREEDIKKAKCIIIPHMFGAPVDITKFYELGIPIIEDCAQSIGAKLHAQKKVGTLGDISMFSFRATKLITGGSGGMIASNSDKYIRKIRQLMKYDSAPPKRKGRYLFQPAYNYCMNNITAALCISQLERLGSFISARKRIAKTYNEELSDEFVKPTSRFVDDHIYYRYVVLHERSNSVVEFLNDNNIEARSSAAHILHRYLNLDGNKFPNAEYVASRTASLPIYPSLKETEIDGIVNLTNESVNI